MRQLVYTMFINNNGAWFHLWRKENLVKHQKDSKHYENDCRLYYALNVVCSLLKVNSRITASQ